MPRLLDLALTLSETGVVEPACVFNALEQLVETCTIADCEDVFTWVEARRGRLSADALWRRGKLVMLRTCNELQRRLSKTADTVLRGRVLLLLSSLYPLSERSALNLGGNYNAGNTTELDELDADTAEATDANAKAEGVVVDRAFYETFWSLQKFFSNPRRARARRGWKTFCVSLRSVLDNFETHRLDKMSSGELHPELNPRSRRARHTSKAGIDAGTKYLTAAPLLHLQLRDPAFRRHFLVQCAVFLGLHVPAVQGCRRRGREGREEARDGGYSPNPAARRGVRRRRRPWRCAARRVGCCGSAITARTSSASPRRPGHRRPAPR